MHQPPPLYKPTPHPHPVPVRIPADPLRPADPIGTRAPLPIRAQSTGQPDSRQQDAQQPRPSSPAKCTSRDSPTTCTPPRRHYRHHWHRPRQVPTQKTDGERKSRRDSRPESERSGIKANPPPAPTNARYFPPFSSVPARSPEEVGQIAQKKSREEEGLSTGENFCKL